MTRAKWANQSAQRQARRRAGQCERCPQPLAPGSTVYCVIHRELARARCRRSRRAHGYQEKRAGGPGRPTVAPTVPIVPRVKAPALPMVPVVAAARAPEALGVPPTPRVRPEFRTRVGAAELVLETVWDGVLERRGHAEFSLTADTLQSSLAPNTAGAFVRP